jgi:hypothetical protein
LRFFLERNMTDLFEAPGQAGPDFDHPAGQHRGDQPTDLDPVTGEPAVSMCDWPMIATIFLSRAATEKGEAPATLRDIAQMARETQAPAKDALPWVKLARFGDLRTPRGSLRHDANLLEISGIEADYDSERMPIAAAVAQLASAGVAAVVYASPSHREDAPRWRVMCPLSEPLPPGRRKPLVAHLDAILGRVLARESFTLSQAYYIGGVIGRPAREAVVVDGMAIDRHAEQHPDPAGGAGTDAVVIASADDLTAFVRRRKVAAPHDDPPDQPDATETLIGRIVGGAGCYPAMIALAARLIGAGTSTTMTGHVLHGLLLARPAAARDDGWRSRLDDIPRIVASAAGKFGAVAESRRALWRLAGRMIRAQCNAAEVRGAVLAEAEKLGIDAAKATEIIDRVAQQEIFNRRS